MRPTWRRTRRILLWGTASALTVAAVLALLTFTYFWRSPGYVPGSLPVSAAEARVIPRDDYREEHPRPYVYRRGDVVVFGAEHTKEPDDPQLDEIDRRWRELRPTVVLLEGRLGFLAPGFMDPVEHYGETGHVYALARRDDVTRYTWEFPVGDLTRELAATHAKDRVALFLVLRPYFSQMRTGRPESPEEFLAEYLPRAADPAVRGAVSSVADIDRIWQRDFPDKPNWRDLNDWEDLPGYLHQIGNHSNDLRNRYLVRLVDKLRADGERVFVICGSSHAVLIEPALT
ncbi:hypothetical protein AB0M36_07355 [Actinoplanes sp. NPDC051346]|uniref:hypothetical protein n=1 Tax=Actinoplanes sp. NPDC051346 TaxID=3155048 RepID=UPI00343B3A4A